MTAKGESDVVEMADDDDWNWDLKWKWKLENVDFEGGATVPSLVIKVGQFLRRGIFFGRGKEWGEEWGNARVDGLQ